MATGYIRHRFRSCASPKRGMKSSWGEYQVVIGRKIYYRGDTEDECRSWASNNDVSLEAVVR